MAEPQCAYRTSRMKQNQVRHFRLYDRPQTCSNWMHLVTQPRGAGGKRGNHLDGGSYMYSYFVDQSAQEALNKHAEYHRQ